MTESMSVKVRVGDAADLPTVLALVRELAAHVNASEQLAVDLATYQRDYAAGAFSILIAETPTKEPLGMMLYYPAYSTWKGRMLYLEDFVVAEAARRRGVGQALWSALLEEVRRGGYALLKWQVVDWNEPARAFYRKVGAELEGEWENGKVFV